MNLYLISFVYSLGEGGSRCCVIMVCRSEAVFDWIRFVYQLKADITRKGNKFDSLYKLKETTDRNARKLT